MEISVAKGKWVYQIDSGLRILITNYVYYDGIKKHKLYFQSGFGANTVSESVELNEVDFQNFMKNLSFTLKNNLKKEQNKINIKVMAENNKINDLSTPINSLNDVLLESIKEVKSGNMDNNKAKSISTLSQTLINSFKVSVEIEKLNKSEKSKK